MGLFGSLFGSSKQKVEQKPWEVQRPFLKRGFYRANDIYRARLDKGPYPGDFYAGLDPLQREGVGVLAQYGRDPALAQGATQAAVTGLGEAGRYTGQAADIYRSASQDPTVGIIGRAGLFSANPYVQDMIRAAARDDIRAVTEGVLPRLDMAASATGNLNSSRAGVAEAIARRSLEDRIGDISANIRGGLFGRGLDLGASLWGQQLGTMLAANQQTGKAYLGSLGLSPTAQTVQSGRAGQLLQAGGILQKDAQKRLEEALRKWTYPEDYQQKALEDYWRIVGAASYGSEQKVPGPSPFAKGLGLLAGGLSLVSGLGGLGLFGAGAGAAAAAPAASYVGNALASRYLLPNMLLMGPGGMLGGGV